MAASSSFSSSSPSSRPSPRPLFEIVDVPGKGKGVIALQFIRQGTVFISERPLFEISEQDFLEDKLSSLVQSLPPDLRATYLSYPPREKMPDLYEARAHHLIPHTGGRAFYEVACRLNHSCSPNCSWSGPTSHICESVA